LATQETFTTSSTSEFSTINFDHEEETSTTMPLQTTTFQHETGPTPFSFDFQAFDSDATYSLPNFQTGFNTILGKRSYDHYSQPSSRQPYGYTMLMDNLYKAVQDIEHLKRATKRSFERLGSHLADTEDRLHKLDTITYKIYKTLTKKQIV
jgi:hypothetical protein